MEIDPGITSEYGVVAGILWPDFCFSVVNFNEGDYYYTTTLEECRRFLPMETTHDEIRDAIEKMVKGGDLETIGFSKDIKPDDKFKLTTK